MCFFFQGTLKSIMAACIVLTFFGCNPPEDENVKKEMSSHKKKFEVKLQQYLDNKIKTLKIPGVSLYIDIPGQLPVSISAGVSDKDAGTRLRPLDRFRIASVTKTFTAAAVLLSAEKGLLSLDDSVEKWLPGSVPNAKKITVRHLLQHTSGISDYYQGEKGIKKQVSSNPLKVWTPGELIEIGASMSPLSDPGQRWAYSNTGYVMLGLIIEKAWGTSYKNVIHSNLLEPLGLNDTYVPSDKVIPGSHAHGYADLSGDGVLEDVTDLEPSVIWSAGGMISNTKDLVCWAKALYGGNVLNEKSMKEMYSFTDTGYENIQYGFGVYKYPQEGIVGHDGDFMGFSSQMLYDINSKLAIAVLTNRLPPHATDIVIEVLQLLSQQ